MSKKKGLSFSSAQKTKIVLEVLKEENTLIHIASKYKTSPKTIRNWKNKFLENASLAFGDNDEVSEYKTTISELEKENDALAKSLGKSTVINEFLTKKLKSLDSSKIKTLIEPKHKNISVSEQCKILEISRSSYYYDSEVTDLDEQVKILEMIAHIYDENPDYGYRYIHLSLLEEGYNIGKDRVLKYMQLLEIKSVQPMKKEQTSVKIKEHKIYSYLLKKYWNKKKQVLVEAPNEVWSGDITYIRTDNGFMYLAAIIDWHTKAILSYKISNTMDESLSCAVLEDALMKYPKPKIFNSDQGSQYTARKHIEILQENNIKISMNGKGRSIDNIAIERFFRTLKYGNIYINNYETVKDLKLGIKQYMNKYNFRRYHSSINYKKPMELYSQFLKGVI